MKRLIAAIITTIMLTMLFVSCWGRILIEKVKRSTSCSLSFKEYRERQHSVIKR